MKNIKYTIYFFIILLALLANTSNSKADFYLENSAILKPFTSQATLYLSYDDGIQCFINDQLVINALEEYHVNKYWNRELDVLKYLKKGQNLIACRVSNGDGNKGDGGGNFDAELIVDGKIVFSRGNGSNCGDGSSWKYYGQGGSISQPAKDSNSYSWYQSNYNDYNWNFGYAPFGGGNGAKKCTIGILKKSPDDAWFRKYFNVTNLQSDNISLSAPAIIPQPAPNSNYNISFYPPPVLIRLGENPQVDMSRIYITKSQKPVITGLTKYNSAVKIYLDGKYAGDAKVQGGEKSGAANFYYYPELTGKRHTYFAVAHNKITKEISFPSKLITFEIW